MLTHVCFHPFFLCIFLLLCRIILLHVPLVLNHYAIIARTCVKSHCITDGKSVRIIRDQVGIAGLAVFIEGQALSLQTVLAQETALLGEVVIQPAEGGFRICAGF